VGILDFHLGGQRRHRDRRGELLEPLMPWIARAGRFGDRDAVFLWLLTFVNCYGIKASGWVQSVTTVLKLIAAARDLRLGVVFAVRARR
jgi:hypothetical protein